MGVDSLRMSAGSLLRVKWAVRSFSQAQMRVLLEEVDALEDGAAVRALLHRSLEQAGLGGLVRAGR
jgi:phosphotransferase system enzyme I (PtsP)